MATTSVIPVKKRGGKKVVAEGVKAKKTTRKRAVAGRTLQTSKREFKEIINSREFREAGYYGRADLMVGVLTVKLPTHRAYVRAGVPISLRHNNVLVKKRLTDKLNSLPYVINGFGVIEFSHENPLWTNAPHGHVIVVMKIPEQGSMEEARLMRGAFEHGLFPDFRGEWSAYHSRIAMAHMLEYDTKMCLVDGNRPEDKVADRNCTLLLDGAATSHVFYNGGNTYQRPTEESLDRMLESVVDGSAQSDESFLYYSAEYVTGASDTPGKQSQRSAWSTGRTAQTNHKATARMSIRIGEKLTSVDRKSVVSAEEAVEMFRLLDSDENTEIVAGTSVDGDWFHTKTRRVNDQVNEDVVSNDVDDSDGEDVNRAYCGSDFDGYEVADAETPGLSGTFQEYKGWLRRVAGYGESDSVVDGDEINSGRFRSSDVSGARAGILGY